MGSRDHIAANQHFEGRKNTAPLWRVLPFVYLAALAVTLLRAHWGNSTGTLFTDTDDAMRMVVVTDLLNGQGWYDHVQHRLNTPFGAEIHWSRLIDLPLAGLSLLLRPFLGEGTMAAVGHIWPLLLLFILLWVSGRLVLRLVGPEGLLPALVLPIVSPAVTNEFGPGRVDHHNVQIILTLAIAWTTIEALKRPGFAVWTGILAATALAIATESLPAIAASILAFGLVWIFAPDNLRPVRGFAISFAAATLLHLVIALPPERWLQPTCDALSIDYVAAALIAGAALLLLCVIPAPRQWPWRLLIGVSTGAASVAIVFMLFPQCLDGPYAGVDPWLRENWIYAIAEAKPWWESLSNLPAYTVAVGLPPLFGLAIITFRLLRVPEDRAAWGLLALFLGIAALVMLAQVRGARLTTMLAIPAAAWLIAILRERFIARQTVMRGVALLSGWIAFAGVVVVIAVTAFVNVLPNSVSEVREARADRAQCMAPEAFRDLAQMPAQRVMAPIDLGSHLLLETPHSVVGAPYHRNEQGVHDVFRFLNEDPHIALEILRERQINLVVICPEMPEMRGLFLADAQALVRQLRDGTLPDWLVPIPSEGPLDLYRVTPVDTQPGA
ncbi:hypothetical protein GCM10007989_16840 [Devosia pacifica]|uniref:Uncharacterized protein n=1 Tax=Devosia pacifica TaxID=1335967 RepID=A0A918S5Q0_9HYPH|nr:hypothetical protein [Devosia pacifica]GHA22100.1 hypothetical protein GCM10007989_16840 [Devosia pacifica]